MIPYEQNRRAWNELSEQGDVRTRPAGDADFRDPLSRIDPCGWLGSDLVGRRVLCLAAGGGKHSVLFAAVGAVVTVVDLSPRMLETDRKMAAAHGLRLTTVEASMDDLRALPENHFEVVIQPVSTCYVPDVSAVYREVAQVIAAGGIYISQHKQPVTLQAGGAPLETGYALLEQYYRTGPLPPVSQICQHREASTVEFLHRWEDLLGGLCRAGFIIEDVVEPIHAEKSAAPGTFGHRSLYAPPFVTLKARRTMTPLNGRILWTQ